MTKEITYLTGIVQHLKRQIRGFRGNPGPLEGTKEQFSKSQEDILLAEIERIKWTIQRLYK